MSGTGSTTVGIRQWVDKASLRLAECEAEGRRLEIGDGSARAAKLEARSRRYQRLVDYLRAKGAAERAAERTEDDDPLISLEEELMKLRARVLEAAAHLIRDKAQLRDLKTRWGLAVDRYLSEREAKGLSRGPVPSLDFTFPPPAPGASEEERTAHRVLRSIGL
jgi:hypothetical protein